MVELRTTSKRAYAKGPFQDCCCQCPHSCGLHRRPSNTSRWFWFSFLWSHCSFPLSLGAGKVLFVPSKTGVSVSPSLVEVLSSSPTGLQGQIPWGFLVPLSDAQSGKPDEGFRAIATVRDFFGSILQPVGHPPSEYGI